MPWRLVFLGIADCAERAMGLHRDFAQRRSGKGQRRRGKETPIRITGIKSVSRGSDREPRAVEAGQAVCELVLHRLELTDQLTELLAHLGVLNGHVERALRRAGVRGPAKASRAALAMSASRPAGTDQCTAGVLLKFNSAKRRHRESRRRTLSETFGACWLYQARATPPSARTR